jgi:hypothetical protein
MSSSKIATMSAVNSALNFYLCKEKKIIWSQLVQKEVNRN